MMKAKLAVMSLAVLAGLVAGCDKPVDPAGKTTAQNSPAESQSPQLSSNATVSKDNLPPIQGQVDTKEPVQRRDFETKKP
jgi:hypothetical protein